MCIGYARYNTKKWGCSGAPGIKSKIKVKEYPTKALINSKNYL
jgi:hypothetical protein